MLAATIKKFISELEVKGFMIYFIQGKETNKIKIGLSIQPESRLRQLQTGSPDILSVNSRCNRQ
jgi:hypothetical protein